MWPPAREFRVAEIPRGSAVTGEGQQGRIDGMGLHAVKATLARRDRAYLLSRHLSEGKGCWRRRAGSARILMGRGICLALVLVSGAFFKGED